MCNAILGVGEKLSHLAIPLMLVAVFALAAFAYNSYKLFRVSLPFVGAVVGAFFGADILGNLIGKMVPAVAAVINPSYLAAIVVAVILALICAKHHEISMLIVGAMAGFMIFDGPLKTYLLQQQVTHDVMEQVGPVITALVGVGISLAGLVILAFLVGKFFKPIYIALISVCAMAAAGVLLATFVFANTNIQEIAVIVLGGVGAAVGIHAAVKQLNWWYLGI